MRKAKGNGASISTTNGVTPDWADAAKASADTIAAREPIIRKRFRQPLPCKVVDSEKLAEKADELATVVNERLRVKQEKREANARFREQIAAFDEREKTLAFDVSSKTEERFVDCVERLTATNTVETVRLDTNEIIGTRAARAEELQDPLFGVDDLDDEDLDEPPPSRIAADTEPPPPGPHDVDPLSPSFDASA